MLLRNRLSPRGKYKQKISDINKNLCLMLSPTFWGHLTHPIYPEHDDAYMKECLDNLTHKGIEI